MDPTQCYLEMMEAMRDGDLTTAHGRALALRDWLERGGFYPPEYNPSEIRTSITDVLRQSAESDESS
jgi:hypothetical protein